MKKSKENSEQYKWGTNCRGWHLVQSENLSVIEELMPAHTSEEKHYHNFSQQFFYVLNGSAIFELEKEIVEVKKGEGIHIYPQIAHQIKNEESTELEFIVISQPTTRGDRINEPFAKNKLNLNGKKFRSISSSNNGEVSPTTLFEYRQKGNVIWATYQGGGVLFGTLSGRIEQQHLTFTYQHQNTIGDFKTGKCESIIKIEDGILILEEKWQWTCDDYSKGESVLKELKQ
ncbi:MAG: hypothetical protein Mars2KO_09440 [Maribacter sp.]